MLLDEMYSDAIAVQLRARGHDVVAVTERPELRNLGDEELLRLMADEERVIVTENAAHFVPFFTAMLGGCEPCHGLLLTSNESMPRRSDTIGLFVSVFARELEARPHAEALLNQIVWLGP
ncbi:MAG: DUF5615 family PIN-like protein [Actinobacteria bacterium]|nr:DUF5615 family PIN-like protein [Actinomycetota bacterium]